MESDFLGKKLIVIGGTSGIVKAVASVVLRNGGNVMVVGRRGDKTKAATVELGLQGAVRKSFLGHWRNMGCGWWSYGGTK
jgi:NAD(P)-dependent dehydrogenase (short-subunit alcohol dehydrogenase family)